MGNGYRNINHEVGGDMSKWIMCRYDGENFIPIKEEKKPLDPITLCEQALWGLQHVNYIKLKTTKETQYQHGFRIGYNQAKRLGLDLIEKVIEELKRT